ncbi:MAG: DUF3310 domain-containing protein [Staphylococcus xylosus]|uniref:DUF3310 domain-containing protein n=1 Tax=Staphylococcus xylosus TaxID=1288 RepID=UPI000AD1226D|nr:DUF3310 domain-containing protein [Staphylococcus xylosus]
MKIRDLNLDDYVIVYDIGKSEYSEGMTVVGRVDEIIFNEDDKNEAGIDSLGNFYHFDDSNYFDLWSNYIESKTESVSDKSIPKAGQEFYFDAKDLGPHNFIKINNQSNDVQQRKRNDTVNHPSHYNYGEIEVIDFIEQVTQHYNANVAYHIGNAIKYLSRSPHKNGKEDVAKAKWYIERAFENWEVK